MDGRNTRPYQGGSNGIGGGGQSSASFASISKLRPPTYLAQAPTFSPAKPRQSSASFRRSLVGESSVDSIQKETSSASIARPNGTTQQRRGRKSAFDTFDELSFCNDLASKIANELAARPSRSLRRSVPIDPWRGTIPGSDTASSSAQGGAHISTTETLDTHENGIEDQEEREVQDDEESDDDEDSESEEDSEEEENEDEMEEDMEGDTAALNPERTERTRLAAEAFLQRLSEREANGEIDESEKGLEKQVFEVFGGNGGQSEGPEIRASVDQLEQEDVSPEVAMQVAQMLQKSATQNQAGQKPLIQEVDQPENSYDADPSEILGDSSVEYDQLKSTSSEAARLRGEMSEKEDELLEDEVDNDEDDDSIPGEAGIQGEEEGEEDNDEEEDEDDESEGVGEDYYDEERHHQNLYSQPSRSSMGMFGSNQEEAISLIDSDEEDELPANSQPADYNRMAHDAAQYERYQDGSDDEQEDYEGQEEGAENEDDEMYDEEEEDEGEMHAQNGMELLNEGIEHASANDENLFQNSQQMPAFDANLATSMPSDPSHLWQNSISLQALNDLAQAPPALFEQNMHSDQSSFQTSIPHAAFSPNLFDQAFPASSSNIDDQAIPQIAQQNPTWSSFPVPPSPAPVPPPPPPAEAEAIGTADGEALLQLKEQVNEQMEDDQQRSNRTSMSPVPPSTVMTPHANQSTASTPKPTAGHVKDGSDLVDLKNVVKRAAALRSQRTSVASDVGTPRNEFITTSAVQPIVEGEENEEDVLPQQPSPQNLAQDEDQNLGQEIEITEVRSTTGDQALEHWHLQPDVESVASLIHEHVAESQDNGEGLKELHIQEMLVDEGDVEEAIAGITEVEENESSLDAPRAQAAEVDEKKLPVGLAEDQAAEVRDQPAEVEENGLPADATAVREAEVEEDEVPAGATAIQEAEVEEDGVPAGATAIQEAEVEEDEMPAGATAIQEAEVEEDEVPAGATAIQEAEAEEDEMPADAPEIQAAVFEESAEGQATETGKPGSPEDVSEIQAATIDMLEPQPLGLQEPVADDSVDIVEEALSSVAAPATDPVETVDAVPEEVKEDLHAADKDDPVEEMMKVDRTIPDLEVNVEAPTADENAETKGLTKDLVEEEQEQQSVPASKDQNVEESDKQNLKVPEEVGNQEAETSSADQNEDDKAADTSATVEPRRSRRKRGSITEHVETSTADGKESKVEETDVPVNETRRETRSSAKRAASEALSAKSGNEGGHTHQQHSSPHSHRKPRRSDPDGDMADYVPDDVRQKRMRSRTRSPSVARETVIPSSIGIPDKLLDTSILEEDEEEEEDDDEQQAASPTPSKKKKTTGRKRSSSKKITEAGKKHTQESLLEQTSNTDEPESQSSQPGTKSNPREKTQEQKRIYKRNQKRTYDKKRKRSTRNTTGTDNSSAVGEDAGEEATNDASQNSKDDPEPEQQAETEASAPIDNDQQKAVASSPPMRVTRRRTRQKTED
ncbi:uncharacterized protein FA14DRAFT_173026 [Meira miltonrushii]|uniref:Uncharacterized protein n=1 Tax=Meira miltonrushii TaxID=1280837 RepID=A0A316VCB9_9BASI|nr:uncharacterized protein FA14DRAFT_173026 [Meira miltonrushii]PWN33195.1 hypothetical protein FA14DRAFT_173026 [Meira miltonrushii]